MNLIGYSDDQDILSMAINSERYSDWNTRIAVRAILKDEKNRIALMHVGKFDIYKLPGGGVDQEEKLEDAAEREILEETGCKAKLSESLGIFVEKREQWKLFQISFCYWAMVIENGTINLTEQEKEDKFSLIWADDLEKSLELVSNNKSDIYDNQFIKSRDSAIIKRALVTQR